MGCSPVCNGYLPKGMTTSDQVMAAQGSLMAQEGPTQYEAGGFNVVAEQFNSNDLDITEESLHQQ